MRISGWSSDVCSSDLTVVTGCEGRIDVGILDPAGQPYIGPVGGQTEAGDRGRLIDQAQRPAFRLFIIEIGVARHRARYRAPRGGRNEIDRKSTRLNSSH